ncbi:MAG: YbaB/EbfC family nucleoid-associated protein [Pseudomonadaceae bacterium]|nr:YbaB/EbfC family nucleoid-associated protein [Pseudomonadaceae bacterium]
MKGIGDLMKQAQEMQSKMQDVQAKMATIEVQGESGAGMVKVTMNCRYEVKRVEIDPSLLSEDKAVLEDLLAAACNDTVRRVEKTQAEQMSELTGGINLPFGNFPS